MMTINLKTSNSIILHLSYLLQHLKPKMQNKPRKEPSDSNSHPIFVLFFRTSIPDHPKQLTSDKKQI